MTSDPQAAPSTSSTGRPVATSPSYSITLRVEAPSGHRTASDLVAAVSATGAAIRVLVILCLPLRRPGFPRCSPAVDGTHGWSRASHAESLQARRYVPDLRSRPPGRMSAAGATPEKEPVSRDREPPARFQGRALAP